VQTDPANRNPRYPNTIVVTVSTKGREVPTHVRVQPSDENGFSHIAFAKCEQVLTISKNRLERRIGRLDQESMEQVRTALRVALAL
jgi:mRNA interferase MazF